MAGYVMRGRQSIDYGNARTRIIELWPKAGEVQRAGDFSLIFFVTLFLSSALSLPDSPSDILSPTSLELYSQRIYDS
jgi:hypothetical protein